MKKKNLLIVIISFVCILLLTGCNKKSLTKNEFKSIAEKNGFTTEDVTELLTDYAYIKEGIIATNPNDWKAEFYIAKDKAMAIKLFVLNKTTFENNKSGVSKEKTTEVSNYSTYALTSAGYYMYISRVDNTMLYIMVNEEKKDEVMKFVKTLGY